MPCWLNQVERLTCNQQVTGSIPVRGSINIAGGVELRTVEEDVFNLTTNAQHSIFANKLRAFRVRKGLSIPCAAAHSGIDGKAIYAYENDKATPRFADLKKLAVCYGVTLTEIFSIC